MQAAQAKKPAATPAGDEVERAIGELDRGDRDAAPAAGLAGGGDPDNRRTLFYADGTLRGAVRSCHQVTLFERVKKLGQIRQKHPALRRGTRKTLEVSDELWVYQMETKQAAVGQPPETVYVAINRSDVSQTACSLPAKPLKELVGDASITGPAIVIPPRQARIFVVE